MPAGYSPSDFAALTPEFVLTGVALLVLLLDAFVPKARHAMIAWISLAGLALTAATLVPYAGADLQAYAVSRKVNAPGYDAPDCVEPAL